MTDGVIFVRGSTGANVTLAQGVGLNTDANIVRNLDMEFMCAKNLSLTEITIPTHQQKWSR